jgi:hypothetical protein
MLKRELVLPYIVPGQVQDETRGGQQNIDIDKYARAFQRCL